jgi:hypothetical protein
VHYKNSIKIVQTVVDRKNCFKGLIKGETLQERRKKARLLGLKLYGVPF